MARCDLCKQFDYCAFRSDPDAQCSAFEQKPVTNGDRIRAMSDVELARFIESICSCYYCKVSKYCGGASNVSRASCVLLWKNWVKQEANDEH